MHIYIHTYMISVQLQPTCSNFLPKRTNYVQKIVHKRDLRVVYHDHSSSYSKFLIAQPPKSTNLEKIYK